MLTPLQPDDLPAGQDLLSVIRAGYAAVAFSAPDVVINHTSLQETAARLPQLWQDMQARFFDADNHFYGRPEWGDVREQFANYVLALNAANFGSGYKNEMASTGFCDGGTGYYFAFASRLRAHFNNREGFWPADEMANLTKGQCAKIFQFNTDLPLHRKLCSQFTAHLQALGQVVQNKYGGSFYKMVEASGGSAVQFVTQLAQVPGFADYGHYDGLKVWFMKRAQLTASDLAWKMDSFRDLDQLTIIIDDIIPHVLRMMDILTYSPKLAALVDSGQPLPAHGSLETQLRAVTGHAVGQLAALSGLTERQIDPILWHLGNDGDLRHPTFKPHCCKTTAY